MKWVGCPLEVHAVNCYTHVEKDVDNFLIIILQSADTLGVCAIIFLSINHVFGLN